MVRHLPPGVDMGLQIVIWTLAIWLVSTGMDPGPTDPDVAACLWFWSSGPEGVEVEDLEDSKDGRTGSSPPLALFGLPTVLVIGGSPSHPFVVVRC